MSQSNATVEDLLARVREEVEYRKTLLVADVSPKSRPSAAPISGSVRIYQTTALGLKVLAHDRRSLRRSKWPLLAGKRSRLAARALVDAGMFEKDFYVAQTKVVGVQPDDAALHYVLAGWQSGLSPHPLFDVTYYLAENPDVAAKNIEPVHHYLTKGWREKRNPNLFFDSAYYLMHYQDVAKLNMCPLLHYIRFGWKAGRRAGPTFCGRTYLAKNLDVARAGLEPLAHYMTRGRQEGRQF